MIYGRYEGDLTLLVFIEVCNSLRGSSLGELNYLTLLTLGFGYVLLRRCLHPRKVFEGSVVMDLVLTRHFLYMFHSSPSSRQTSCRPWECWKRADRVPLTDRSSTNRGLVSRVWCQNQILPRPLPPEDEIYNSDLSLRLGLYRYYRTYLPFRGFTSRRVFTVLPRVLFRKEGTLTTPEVGNMTEGWYVTSEGGFGRLRLLSKYLLSFSFILIINVFFTLGWYLWQLK